MKKKFFAGAFCFVMLLLMAMPAFAAEYGEANITPRTKMREIRNNPSIVGAGIYTYSLDQDRFIDRLYWDAQPLSCLSNHWTAQDAADGLNYLIRTYNAGTQVTYPLYTEEEITQDTRREGVELYYFPPEGETVSDKYVLVVGGNAVVVSAEIREGISTAWNLHEMGYPVFVLRYRIGMRAGNNAPLEDVARAVQYITQHAQSFGVRTEDYAILSYSSGGQIAGFFGSDALGYKNYGLPRPGAMLFGYPVNNFFEYKPFYHILIDPDTLQQRYYDLSLSDYITPDYPPSYHWYGRNDFVLSTMCWSAQGPVLEEAFEKNNVPHIYHVYEDAQHATGAGKGTDAEGWLEEAVAFWEEQVQT